MIGTAPTVFTMSILARIFETVAIMAVINGREARVSDLPLPVVELLIEDDVFDLWFATRRRIRNAARYEVEHIDDWSVKSTLVGFDL